MKNKFLLFFLISIILVLPLASAFSVSDFLSDLNDWWVNSLTGRVTACTTSGATCVSSTNVKGICAYPDAMSSPLSCVTSGYVALQSGKYNSFCMSPGTPCDANLADGTFDSKGTCQVAAVGDLVECVVTDCVAVTDCPAKQCNTKKCTSGKCAYTALPLGGACTTYLDGRCDSSGNCLPNPCKAQGGSKCTFSGKTGICGKDQTNRLNCLTSGEALKDNNGLYWGPCTTENLNCDTDISDGVFTAKGKCAVDTTQTSPTGYRCVAITTSTTTTTATVCQAAKGTACTKDGKIGICAYTTLSGIGTTNKGTCVTTGSVAKHGDYYYAWLLGSGPAAGDLCDPDLSDGLYLEGTVKIKDAAAGTAECSIATTTAKCTINDICELGEYTTCSDCHFAEGWSCNHNDVCELGEPDKECDDCHFAEGWSCNHDGLCIPGESTTECDDCVVSEVTTSQNILDFSAPFGAQDGKLTPTTVTIMLTADGISSYTLKSFSIGENANCIPVSGDVAEDYSSITISCDHGLILNVGDVVEGSAEIDYTLENELVHTTVGTFSLTVEAETSECLEYDEEGICISYAEESTQELPIDEEATPIETITEEEIATGSCQEGSLSYGEDCLSKVGACKFWVFSWSGKLAFLSDSFTEEHCEVTKGTTVFGCVNGKWKTKGCQSTDNSADTSVEESTQTTQ